MVRIVTGTYVGQIVIWKLDASMSCSITIHRMLYTFYQLDTVRVLDCFFDIVKLFFLHIDD